MIVTVFSTDEVKSALSEAAENNVRTSEGTILIHGDYIQYAQTTYHYFYHIYLQMTPRLHRR